MFEDEIKMEEKSSNVMPLLMVLGLVLAVGGALAYFILESKRTVSESEATQAATGLLNALGPEQVHFHVGFVKANVDEKPFDPHYKLLAKAGLLKLGKPTYKGLDVALTPQGKELFQALGAKTETNKDGTEAYTVTLATRKLVKISKVEVISPGRAVLEYQWNWEPTKLGLVFDINSPEMKSLTNWESVTLIQKYGATYYQDSKVKTEAVVLLWDDKSNVWKPAS
jgi:hypothetical protein